MIGTSIRVFGLIHSSYFVTWIALPSFHSFLYPDGRSINPDLSFLVANSEEDHIQVTMVRKEYRK